MYSQEPSEGFQITCWPSLAYQNTFERTEVFQIQQKNKTDSGFYEQRDSKHNEFILRGLLQKHFRKHLIFAADRWFLHPVNIIKKKKAY